MAEPPLMPYVSCTLNNVPMTSSALQKSRLPFAIHLYPFAQDDNIPVLSNDRLIIRCAICRAYINPYVRIGDHRSWQCNICNRLNELPPQFIYDYELQQYYDLGTKPELNSETVEYIAGAEYMIRPPQPSCFMFVFDCSKSATEIGFIPTLATAVADSLDSIPGTQAVHYSSPDITSPVIPCQSDGILANMSSKREMLLNFLTEILPYFPAGENQTPVTDTRSALGPAIQVASKIMSPIGGKIVVIQAQLPNHGGDEGSSLLRRDDYSTKKSVTSDKNGEYLTPLINPVTDFYKNLSLDCCEHQVSIDLFNLSTTYADIASISPLTKFSAGLVYHYSSTPSERKSTLIRFDQDLRNYLIRNIGLEAVLRVRFTRGLKIHTFHGNFFTRSSNLLTLPIANPDTGYSLQIAIDDDLNPNTRYVYFQTSVLFTTPFGERRIRIHTTRFPTASALPEIIYGANQTAIVGMLAKMAVDRSQQASIGEAKEALIGAGVDLLEIYALADESRARSYPMGLPDNLRLIPLYILAMLKHVAFKLNPGIKLDDRVAAMERIKTLPLEELVTYIYPDLFPLLHIAADQNDDWKNPISLSAAHIERNGAYLLDAYDVMIIYICEYIDPRWCYDVFGVQDFSSIPEHQDVLASDQQIHSARPRDPANFMAQMGRPTMVGFNAPGQQASNTSSGIPYVSQPLPSAEEIANSPLVNLPEYDNETSMRLRDFIGCLIESRAQKPKFYIIKENSSAKWLFTQYLIDDRSDNFHSYAEFWKFLIDQARK